MERVAKIKPLPRWQLEVWFEDGTHGVISLEDSLWGPVFEPLKDTRVFEQATVDEFGAICWPNGADLAPDALYDRIRKTSEAV